MLYECLAPHDPCFFSTEQFGGRAWRQTVFTYQRFNNTGLIEHGKRAPGLVGQQQETLVI
jgi:hypothetical protein